MMIRAGIPTVTIGYPIQIYPVELFPEKLMGAIQVCIYSLLVWSKMVASAKVFAVYQLFSVLPLIKYLRFLLSGILDGPT